MKKVINRTGKPLTIEQARNFSNCLNRLPNVACIEHRAVYGYATPELAEKANLRAICEAYENYIFLFAGTDSKPFDGFHAYVIAFKGLTPTEFEKLYPDFVVIG